MNEQKISFNLNSLNTLINIKTPAVLGTFASIISNQYEFSPIIGSAIGGCIGFGVQYIQTRNDINNKIESSPYSYVFHANQKLQSKNTSIFKNVVDLK